DVPRSRKHFARGGTITRASGRTHLGARSRSHQGLRLSRLRRGGRGRTHATYGAQGHSDPPRRRSSHRVARARQSCVGDRSRRVRARGPLRSGAVRGKPRPRSAMNVDVVTFGCRLNAYESEVIRRNAVAAGLSDVVVINTCAVTAEAVRQARQTIRKIKRE